MREVARRYKFRGSRDGHEHDYTVEVVARDERFWRDVRRVGEDAPVVDTDLLDAAWVAVAPGADLDGTVETVAAVLLRQFQSRVPVVERVVVWEGDDRWGAAGQT